MTFAAALVAIRAAASTSNTARVWAILSAASAKLDRSRAAATLLSYTPGAADAAHAAWEKIAGWTAIHADMIAVWTEAAAGLSTAELVMIVSEDVAG